MLQRVFISLFLIVSGCEASLTTNYDVDPAETPDISNPDSSSGDVGLLDMGGVADMPAEMPDQDLDVTTEDMTLAEMPADMVVDMSGDMPADMVPDIPVDMVADMPDQATGPVCGNGVIEAPETCDGNCPQSCEVMVCQTATMSGTPQNCDVDCSYQAIVTCTNNDGCCAPGCNANNDDDCVVDCRNPASWPTGWVTYEQEVVTLLNQFRSSSQNCGTRGTFSAAGPLVMSPTLQEASRCHSVDMGVHNTLTHTGSDGSSFSQRASAAGYTGFAANENAGKGYSTPASVVQGWMNSDGHCANVMNPNINRVGVGYYLHATSGRWWTMVGGINGN